MSYYTFARYLLIGLLILSLGGLMGWYLYLRTQRAAITAVTTGRGLNAIAPSSGGGVGSNYRNDVIVANNTGAAYSTTSSPLSSVPQQVWHANTSPVAGFGFVSTDANGTSIYFVERATGYIFSALPTSGAVSRVYGVLTPKVYAAYVSSTGAVIERYPAQGGGVETVVIWPSESSGGSERRSTLPQNMGPFAVSNDTIVYGLHSEATTIISSSNWSGTKTKTLFSTPLSSLRLTLLADGRILLGEAPADGVLGHMYTITKDGELGQFIAPAPGLTLLPQASSTAVLYASSAGGVAHLFVRSGTTVVSVPLSTVADKCVWTSAPPTPKKGEVATSSIAYCAVPDSIPSSQFLDSWYRGEVHTTDSWWKIDATAGTATKLALEWPRGATPPDAVDIQIDSTNSYIGFKDARDQSLWVLRIPK